MTSLTERRWLLATILLVVAYCVPAAAQEQRRGFYTPPSAAAIHAVVAEHGMVVAQEKTAARIGADVLRRGGNAVDAAVATGFAMAVSYPRAGNIGGGGFMIIHSAERHEDVAIDYRETAPAAMTRDIFLGTDGTPDIAKSRDSALGIGVPGTVAGLTLALEKYGSGKFKLADLLRPAIDLAGDGVVITDDSADTLPNWYRRLARWPSSAKIFSRADGTSLRDGDTLVQTDLAATLSAIATQGPRGFYQGPVAEKLVAGIRDAGGIVTTDDLKSYQAVIRAPVRGSYRGYCRPRAISWRSGLHQCAGRNPDLEGLRGQAARQHRSRPCHAVDRCAVGNAAARRQQHHAFFGSRQPRQCGQQHLYAEFQLWRRPGRGRHRRSAQQ